MGSREEGHYDSEQEEETEADETTDETTPMILKPPKRPHPFIFLLLALFPFGEDFRQLGIVGKIYEILKVCNYTTSQNHFSCRLSARIRKWKV